MTCGVYEIVIVATDERYIGSSVNCDNRWSYHRSSLKGRNHRNPTLQAAYDRDGLSGLRFTVLEECDKNIVRQREQHHIDNTECINFSRNCLSDPVEISKERKKKISKALKGNTHWLGKKHTADSKAKLAAAHSKPVYVKYADGREVTYPSRRDAAKAIGVSPSSTLLDWLKGKSTTYLNRGIDEVRWATS